MGPCRAVSAKTDNVDDCSSEFGNPGITSISSTLKMILRETTCQESFAVAGVSESLSIATCAG